MFSQYKHKAKLAEIYLHIEHVFIFPNGEYRDGKDLNLAIFALLQPYWLGILFKSKLFNSC